MWVTHATLNSDFNLFPHVCAPALFLEIEYYSDWKYDIASPAVFRMQHGLSGT